MACLQGLPIALNHYSGSALEDELLTAFNPAWVKLDGATLASHLAGHGCNELQRALSHCQHRGIRLVITRIETPEQLEQVRTLCGIRWGQGYLLGQETATPLTETSIPLPLIDEGRRDALSHTEGCWHCVYSRLAEGSEYNTTGIALAI